MAPGDTDGGNPKLVRGHRRGSVTKAIGALRRFVAERDDKAVKSQLQKIKRAFQDFELAHDEFHKTTLTDEQQMLTSEPYYEEVENGYIAAVDDANQWLLDLVNDTDNTDSSNELSMADMMSMPQLTIETFSGDPMYYKEFKAMFDEMVDSKPIECQYKLSRLLQFTTGQAKSAIRHCALIGGTKGYQQARTILESRFGNAFVISNRIVDNLKNGKALHKPDELQQLSNDLSAAAETLKELNMSGEIENQRSILDIVQRCPPYVRKQWCKRAVDQREDHGAYPTFSDFVKFIKRVAAQASDPVYGNGASGPSNARGSKSTGAGNATCYTVGVEQSGPERSGNVPNTEDPCVLCNQRHRLWRCNSFKSMSPKARFDLVKSNKLCYLCLRSGHRVNDCNFKFTCSVPDCGKRHSKFIHVDPPRRDTVAPTAATATTQYCDVTPSDTSVGDTVGSSVNGASSCLFGAHEGTVYLPIVPVKIRGSDDVYFALLDSGSTNSFVAESVVSELNLGVTHTRYNVNTISSQSAVNKVVSMSLFPVDSTNAEAVELSNMLVVPSIPARRPSKEIDLRAYPHLRDLSLNYRDADIQASIIIGNDNAHLMIPYEVCSNPDGKNEPYATRTYFGWALSGPVAGKSTQVYSHFLQTTLEEQVENLWKVECDESDDYVMSADDRKVIDLWDRETVLVDGHYTVPIPWKQGKPDLPDNRAMAYHRLKSLDRRLEKQGMKDKYCEGIQKFLDKDYAERVPDGEINNKDGRVWYVPHHHVISEAKGGKLRVVMDCSAKYDGVSLNSVCFGGPNLINNLLYVLLRFRQYQHAIMADIEGMYMQVKVRTDDRNCLRFLWYDDDGKITHYRMSSHLFGGVWSGTASTYAQRRICDDNQVSDLVRDVIYRSFYVDDLLRSAMCGVEAREVINSVQDALKFGGFNLTKFTVSDPSLAAEVNIEHRAEVKEMTSGMPSKALGVCWSVAEDRFFYVHRYVLHDAAVTKRSILRQISSLYDPMGLIAPVIMKGRMLFQEVTRLGLHWDDPVPEDIASKWRAWLDSMKDLRSVKFDRCLLPSSFEDGATELLHFCDASQRGYGACSYLRTINKNAEVRVILIMSRGRVAPLRQISIPRLELCAAVQAVRLDALLRKEMDIPFLKSTFFTDSEIVRAYIHNESRRYKTFVANRVSEIRRQSSSDQWHHVDGQVNPSDVLSRGCDGDRIPESWCKGPAFASQYKCDWPQGKAAISVEEDPELVKTQVTGVTVNHACQADVLSHPLEKLMEQYSSMYRLKKAVSWLMRYRSYLMRKDVRKGRLLADEMKEAETFLVSHAQKTTYSDELERLTQGRPVRKSSSIVKLDPTLRDGLLVVGGRLRHATLPDQRKHPVILPRHSKLARLVVEDDHGIAHLGVEWTLSRIRCKYWIVHARNLIKAVKRACVVCKRLYARPVEQKMADLPPERLEPFRRPFTFTGFDIFGPYYVKHGRHEVKRYGLIFTCFSTRAIHIEMLSSLETDMFLNAFIRFVSRRGNPQKIWCDNATTFVGARNELQNPMRQIDRDKIIQTVRRLDIEWAFNPPLASHHGGIWERLIRTVRKVLAAILHPCARLTPDTLHTFLCEVENIINGRPITKCSDDARDELPLTPNHLLIMSDNASLPCGSFSNSYRKQWHHVQMLATAFWQRWLREYLPLLQTRQKWHRKRDDLTVGDLVLIVDEQAPRGNWPLGVVTGVNEGRDGLVRSVRMRSRNKEVVRPVTKVVFLEGDIAD